MIEQDYRIGDAGQPFKYERRDADGDPVVLAGQTVTVVLKPPALAALKTRTCVLAADTLSSTYLLITADLDAVGTWFYEFHETGGGFLDTTKAGSFYVSARLA